MASNEQQENQIPPRRGHHFRHWGETEPRSVDDIGLHVRAHRLHQNVEAGSLNSLTLRLSLPYWPPSVLSSDAVLGESFCGCYTKKGRDVDCECGEDGHVLEWVWDTDIKTTTTHLQNNNKEVRFHIEYSGGTAAIRGSQPMTKNQHYWEIKMTSPVYGTDMMVGIGTREADIHRQSHTFCSLLGSDCETWGLSYTGLFHHKGKAHCYAPRFGQGSIIGVHLDMWNGTLEFYKNRQPLGIACSGLKGKTLFAMVSSTAARSGMRIIRSCSFSSSLQYLCCLTIRKMIAPNKSVLDVVSLPPGLLMFLSNNLSWLLGASHLERSSNERSQSDSSNQTSSKATRKRDCPAVEFENKATTTEDLNSDCCQNGYYRNVNMLPINSSQKSTPFESVIPIEIPCNSGLDNNSAAVAYANDTSSASFGGGMKKCKYSFLEDFSQSADDIDEDMTPGGKKRDQSS